MTAHAVVKPVKSLLRPGQKVRRDHACQDDTRRLRSTCEDRRPIGRAVNQALKASAISLYRDRAEARIARFTPVNVAQVPIYDRIQTA